MCTERIGKLCKVEGVVDFFFLACVDNSLESGLTPSKRSTTKASQVTASGGHYNRYTFFLMSLKKHLHMHMCIERVTGDCYHF